MNRPENAYYPPTWAERFAELEAALASERAARTAAEATIEQVRAWWRYFFKEGPLTPKLKHILDAAPSAALDAHDAQVKAEALEEAKAIVTRVCRDDLSDYYGQIREEVGRALDARAAEIRKAKQ